MDINKEDKDGDVVFVGVKVAIGGSKGLAIYVIHDGLNGLIV